jgi:hypothetical protein
MHSIIVPGVNGIHAVEAGLLESSITGITLLLTRLTQIASVNESAVYKNDTFELGHFTLLFISSCGCRFSSPPPSPWYIPLALGIYVFCPAR